jgi:hypothetical protein
MAQPDRSLQALLSRMAVLEDERAICSLASDYFHGFDRRTQSLPTRLAR